MTGFAAAAFRVSALNAASNVALLLGNAYAARCLGPANVGISAQVLVTVQQASLAFNGGLDTTSVRLVASGQQSLSATARAVLMFRMLVALPLALLWAAWVLATQDPGPLRTAWLLGAPLLVLASVQLPFLFQAAERMPRWAALSTTSSLLVAGAYRLLFHPGMPVGSDLWVLAGVGMAVSLLSMTQGLSIAGLHAADFVREWRDSGRLLISLIADSWRYWLLALLAFVYTGLPVLLVAQLRGDADAGVLRVCLLLAAALEVIFASINSVLLPRLVRSRREGKQALWAQQRRQLVPHVLAGAAVFLLTCVAASPVFNTFLGAQFESGLWPFIVLALSRVVVFVGQIFVWGIVALRLDSALLGAVLCAGVVSVALNLALVPRYSIVGAALAALAAELVIACGCFIVQRRHLAIDGTE